MTKIFNSMSIFNPIVLINFMSVCLNIHSTAQPSPYGFKNQYIGNKNVLGLYNDQKEELCRNFWCINDAYYIFSKASQYKDVDPCVDFKNLTVNQIDEVDAIDDRHIERGFENDVNMKYYERLRKVLAERGNLNNVENRIVKVMRNTYRKCIKSPHTFRHLEVHHDIIEYLKSFGSSPFLSKHIAFNPNRFNAQKDYKFDSVPGNISNEDALWNESQFDLKKIFEIEPWFALNIFFDLEVQRCENDIICLKPSGYRTTDLIYSERFSDFYYDIFKDIFETLEDRHLMAPQHRKYAEDEMYRPAIERLRKFLRARDELRRKLVEENNCKDDNITIKDLNELLSNIGINWLNAINSQLLKRSKLNENSTIYIKECGSKVMKELGDLLTQFDKKSLADTFTAEFIYHHRGSVILHYYGRLDQVVYGTKHGAPRWGRCISEYFVRSMHPALIVMYEQRREMFDRNLADFERDSDDERTKIPESAANFVQEAVDYYKKILINETEIPISISTKILEKLKNINIVTSFSSKLLPFARLEELYKELELKGNENFLESAMEMAKNRRKLSNELAGSWQKRIDTILNAGTTTPSMVYTISEENILYISPRLIMYPYYHPLRPRFFNLATLFSDVISFLDSTIGNHIQDTLPDGISYKTAVTISGPNQIVYEYYKQWLKTHKDREIGANHLTNLQLYWVACVFQDYRKFHRTVIDSFARQYRLQQKYLHELTKYNEGFQEAFNCTITLKELDKLIEYYGILESYKKRSQ